MSPCGWILFLKTTWGDGDVWLGLGSVGRRKSTDMEIQEHPIQGNVEPQQPAAHEVAVAALKSPVFVISLHTS